MGVLVLLLVAVGTTVLAVSAATGILRILFHFMDVSAVGQRAVARQTVAAGSAVHVQHALGVNQAP